MTDRSANLWRAVIVVAAVLGTGVALALYEANYEPDTTENRPTTTTTTTTTAAGR